MTNEEVGITFETVKKRAARGVVVLTGRTFILNLVSLVAQGFLWSFLTKFEFGVFWIVSAIINFLSYFSDIGLGASLIQKKDDPTDEDLKTTFVVQESLVIALLVILFIFTPKIAAVNSLSSEGITLLYALGISFFISSLKSIPSVLLEREIEFVKFAIPQVVETLAYNLVLVFLAWKGFGLASFTYAVLIRSTLGLVIVYILKPWRPGFSFSLHSLKGLLKFGILYQLNSLLATVKDDGMVLVLGGILGPAGVGILGTAQRLAQYPLRFFMDHVTKVTFPAFARIQNEKGTLGSAVTRSIFFICFLVMPTLTGILVLAPMLTNIIPGYKKWEEALLPLLFISGNIYFAAVTTQLTNVLSAIGKIKITFFLMVMWTALTYILVPVLGMKLGVNGAAFGYFLVGLSSIFAIIAAKRYVNFSLSDSALRPFLGSIGMGVIVFVLKGFLPQNIYSVGIVIIMGVVSYGVIMLMLLGISFITDTQASLKHLFSPQSDKI